MQFSIALEQTPHYIPALEGRAITCLHASDVKAASRDVALALECGEPTARLLTISGVVRQYEKDVYSAMAYYNVSPVYF